MVEDKAIDEMIEIVETLGKKFDQTKKLWLKQKVDCTHCSGVISRHDKIELDGVTDKFYTAMATMEEILQDLYS